MKHLKRFENRDFKNTPSTNFKDGDYGKSGSHIYKISDIYVEYCSAQQKYEQVGEVHVLGTNRIRRSFLYSLEPLTEEELDAIKYNL